MKYGNSNYMQLSRKIINDPKYETLSINAKWLFVVLNDLEQRFCGGDGQKDFFLRSNEQLAGDSGMSLATLKRAKAELENTDLIKTGVGWWKKDGCKEKHVTSYRVML